MNAEWVNLRLKYCISLFVAPDCLCIQILSIRTKYILVFYYVFVVVIVVLWVVTIKCCVYIHMPFHTHISSCVCKNQWDFILCQTFSLVFFLQSKVIIYFAFFSLLFVSVMLMVCSTLFEVHKINQLLPRNLLTKRKRRKKKWREKWSYTHTYIPQAK